MEAVIETLIRIRDTEVLLEHNPSAPGDPSVTVTVLFHDCIAEFVKDFHPLTFAREATAIARAFDLREVLDPIHDGLTDLWKQRELALTEAVKANRA